METKIKKFKTTTNDGKTVHVAVVLLSSCSEHEDAVIIETRRLLVTEKQKEMCSGMNARFPMFMCQRETKNYALIVTRTAPMKISTFKMVMDIVDGFSNEPKVCFNDDCAIWPEVGPCGLTKGCSAFLSGKL